MPGPVLLLLSGVILARAVQAHHGGETRVPHAILALSFLLLLAGRGPGLPRTATMDRLAATMTPARTNLLLAGLTLSVCGLPGREFNGLPALLLWVAALGVVATGWRSAEHRGAWGGTQGHPPGAVRRRRRNLEARWLPPGHEGRDARVRTPTPRCAAGAQKSPKAGGIRWIHGRLEEWSG